MSTEHGRTEVVIDADPRLVPALSGVVHQAAQRAGLAGNAWQELAAATEQACRETFPLLSERDPFVKLTVEDFADRVEVTLEHTGEALPTAGLDSFVFGGEGPDGAGGPSGMSGIELMSRVDRVQYETREGRSRTTLIKYAANGPAKT